MKNIALIAIALLASAAFGEPSGPYMSYLGYEVGNGGTGEYSNYIGAYSGMFSTGISRCGFYGPASGQYGYKLYGCNGVGFYALANSEYMTNVFAVGTSAARGADHCEDCIYIGKDAGRNFSHRKGDVVIGDVLIHTNGVTTIKGLDYTKYTHNLVYEVSKDGTYSALTVGTRKGIVGNESFVQGYICEASGDNGHAEGSETYAIGNFAHSEGHMCMAVGSFSHSEGIECVSDGYASHAEGNTSSAYGRFSHAEGIGTFAIGDYSHSAGASSIASNKFSYVWQGVESANNLTSAYVSHGDGTYNINPVGGIDGFWVGEKTMRKHISDEIEKPRTSFTIEDEDTGEKYIIKVKSGALKLYKVEETEE